MKKYLLPLAIGFVGFMSFSGTSQACTDFRLTAKDGTVLITRSLEYAEEFNSNIRTSNRNRQFSTTTPDGKPAMTWKSKYGYVFVDGLNQDVAIDGMNEAGLSFEYLYLPAETQYQPIPAGKNSQALPYVSLGDWILSNFKTVDEVRAALSNVYVFQQMLPGLGSMVFPLHASIFDASGKGIVVEFIDGKMKIYDNIGVMTNSPAYDWHVTDLRNYLSLSPYNPNPTTVNGTTYAVLGQGAGMLGLPGDISPPSRFVKTAFLAKVAYPVANNSEALNLAEHIINNVDIPNGLSRAVTAGKEISDKTQWVVFKDLTHKMFYYRTYNDMTVRSVAMDKIDFSEKAPRLIMPLAESPYVMDVTERFLNAKAN